MSNIFISGITGRSGRYLGKKLIETHNTNQNKIIALVRNQEKFNNLFGKQNIIKCKVGDISDNAAITDIFITEKIDTVFHIYNIKHSINIVNAALKSNYVKRLILVHTTGIYSKYKSASSEYLEIESTVKKLLEGSNISLTILRPTMIYGSLDDKNISTFIGLVDKFRIFPIVNGGKYELQPVNHIDLGNAYYQVLTNPEKTKNKNYTLSGGTVIYLKDILENISKFLGKKTLFISIPFGLAYAISKFVYILSFKKIDYRERVQRLVEPRAYDHNDATADFGYSPIEFLIGLEREVNLYLNSKSK